MSKRFLCLHLALIAPLVLTSQLIGQTADNAQQFGKDAVHAVVQHILLIANNPATKTGQQLPLSGRWSIGSEHPSGCPEPPPGGAQPCLRVIYKVPEADVTCEWVVLLSQDGANGAILEQNDDATHYFIQKLSPDNAKPLVLKRRDPNYPPIAIAAHVQGEVKLQIVVGTDGKPVSGTTLSGPPMLIGAAKEAITGWAFKPLQIGARTVSFQTEITFHFETFGPPSGKVTSVP
jgi:TonB family protein